MMSGDSVAKFVYSRSIDLKSVFYFDNYNEGSMSSSRLYGVRGLESIELKGSFEKFHDSYYDDEFWNGPVSSVTYKQGGQVALQISGLHVSLMAMDASENSPATAIRNLTRGNDLMIGSSQSDSLAGNDGNDVLRGNGGTDTLSGGGGSDRLNGGAGADVLTGGAGRDTFIFSSRSEASRDTVTDFDRYDRIDLSGIDANEAKRGDQAFKFISEHAFTKHAGELHVSNGVLSGDVDGDGKADFAITVKGVALTVDDFIL